jgi:hypothetical protein
MLSRNVYQRFHESTRAGDHLLHGENFLAPWPRSFIPSEEALLQIRTEQAMKPSGYEPRVSGRCSGSAIIHIGTTRYRTTRYRVGGGRAVGGCVTSSQPDRRAAMSFEHAPVSKGEAFYRCGNRCQLTFSFACRDNDRLGSDLLYSGPLRLEALFPSASGCPWLTSSSGLHLS